MSWTIEFDKRVEKDLRALDKQAVNRILKYLAERVAAADDPRRFGKPLSGELGEYWRYRVGPYRVLATMRTKRCGYSSFGWRIGTMFTDSSAFAFGANLGFCRFLPYERRIAHGPHLYNGYSE